MKVIKSIQVTWDWSGDDDLIIGFNVALTPNTENPNTQIVTSSSVNKDTRSYKFKDVTLDDVVTYTAWVQAVYSGKDSDWISAGDLVVSDDGTATIATSAVLAQEIADIDISGPIGTNNDSMAQSLGYADYAAMEAAAVGGQTVINGGYLNAVLVEAETITASMLASTNLITTAAQITNGIITNAEIANSTITNAQIANGTIKTANIEDAAITNAQLGNAQVDTLKIQDNAVTVPVSAYTAGAISIIDSYSNWTTVQSISSLNSLGQPVLVIFTGVLYNTHLWSNMRELTANVKIVDDLGTNILADTQIAAAWSVRTITDPSDIYEFATRVCLALSAVYTPTSGNRTISVMVRNNEDYTYVNVRALTAIGLKK